MKESSFRLLFPVALCPLYEVAEYTLYFVLVAELFLKCALTFLPVFAVLFPIRSSIRSDRGMI